MLVDINASMQVHVCQTLGPNLTGVNTLSAPKVSTLNGK